MVNLKRLPRRLLCHEGLADDARVIVVVAPAGLTVWVKGADVLVVKFASPL
jgi:hypothetical protein